MNDAISQRKLKELLYYNPKFEIFVNKTNRGSKAKIGRISGGLNAIGYVRIKIHDNHYFAHRLAFLYVDGSMPSGQVDHINGIKHDNSFSNLRAVSSSENAKNTKIRVTNKTGITGVVWHKRDYKWFSYMMSERKRIHIGYFDDFFEACCARKSAEITHKFHANHGRR